MQADSDVGRHRRDESGSGVSGLMNTNCAMAVSDIVKEFSADRSRLMDIVLAIQHHFGHVGDDAVVAIATGLGIHPVEIEDMVSFYAFLDREARGRNRIRLSRTPISLIKGAEEVARAFEEALDLTLGETSPDGQFTLEWTSDIGMADQEPSALINGMVLTALTPARCPAGRRRSSSPRKEGWSISISAARSAGGKAAESDGPAEPRAVWPTPLGAARTRRRYQGRPHTAARKGDRGDHPIEAPGAWRSRLSHRDEVAPYAQGGRHRSLHRLQC